MKILILILLFQQNPKPVGKVNLYDSIIANQKKYAALIKKMDSIKKQQTFLIKKYKK